MTYLRDSLLVHFDGFGYEKDGLLRLFAFLQKQLRQE